MSNEAVEYWLDTAAEPTGDNALDLGRVWQQSMVLTTTAI